MKGLIKKSLSIDPETHKEVQFESVRTGKDMYELIAEAWAVYKKHSGDVGIDRTGSTTPPKELPRPGEDPNRKADAVLPQFEFASENREWHEKLEYVLRGQVAAKALHENLDFFTLATKALTGLEKPGEGSIVSGSADASIEQRVEDIDRAQREAEQAAKDAAAAREAVADRQKRHYGKAPKRGRA